MSKKLYSTLGINENASDKEIKKAYRRLATEYHPDKNKSPDAEEKIKEINAAYAVLGDKDKKSKYDRFGDSILNENRSSGAYHQYTSGNEFHMNVEDIFKNMFGDIFGNSSINLDLKYKIGIPLGIAVNGGDITINVENKNIRLNIPSGIHNGTTLRLSGKGKTINNKSGDLYITVIIQPEKGYVLDGNDIIVNDTIDLKTAIFGGKKQFDFFGEDITYNIPKNTKPGQKLRIQKGLKNGVTYINLMVNLPKAEERPDLEKIL